MNSPKIEKFPTWSEVREELFSKEEIKEIDAEVAAEMQAMESLQESVSKEVAAYMARENIGFRELTRRLGASPRHTSRIVKGNCNLTMASIAEVAALLGKKVRVEFYE